MQVTHAADHVTHAVIGAGQTHAFGINQSIEFFRILSSSLYSDKMLAVVREILCNAWDAHIEGGCTDTPVEVLIDSNKLVIRDFGPGISPEDIIKNYTTYGGTTKIENEEVTGGFGLGSKAPFAYADHFEVISHYQGTKTIYNMSLSSALVDGKPSVMTILDLPTAESGVQVSVNLRSINDRFRFEQLVRRIAANGEMNVKLNGDTVPTFPFSKSPNGFVILPNETAGGNSSRVYIRYGHVIYPLEEAESYQGLMQKAQRFLTRISGYHKSPYYNSDQGRWALVLQAAPGSVSITPSRESLSMTDRTTANVTKLLEKFVYNSCDGMEKQCLELLQKAIEDAINQKNSGILFVPQRKMPNKRFFEELSTNLPEQIVTIDEAAAHYMCNSTYPEQENFLLQDLLLRIGTLIQAGVGDKGLLNSFRRELQRRRNPKAYSNWFYRKMIWPLVRDMRASDSLRDRHLMVVDQFQDRYHGPTEIKVQPYKLLSLRQLRFTLPYLRKILILSHNRVDAIIESRPRLTSLGFDDIKGTLAYIVPRNPKKIEEAREFFTSRGYTIVDLTPSQQTAKASNSSAPVSRPRSKGFPLLATLLNDRDVIDLSLPWEEDSKRSETAGFVCMMSPNRQTCPEFWGSFSHNSMPSIIRLFGKDGILAPSTVSYDKLIQNGMVSIDEWVFPRLLEEFKTNKLIRRYYKNYKAEDVELAYYENRLLKIIKNDPVLRKKFNLPDLLPQREQDFVLIVERFRNWDFNRIPELGEIRELKKKWTASASLRRLEKLSKNFLLGFIDTNQIEISMKLRSKEQQDKLRKLILYAMKG